MKIISIVCGLVDRVYIQNFQIRHTSYAKYRKEAQSSRSHPVTDNHNTSLEALETLDQCTKVARRKTYSLTGFGQKMKSTEMYEKYLPNKYDTHMQKV